MFLIVSGHFMQLRGFYAHFSNGAAFPFQPDDYTHFAAGISSQSWLMDKIFLAADFSYWSLNFTFYALSGLSLWFATRLRNTFSLKEYFYNRFFGVYTGYLVAVAAAFLVGILLLGHHPGEHDLNYLILGAVRARETDFYNNTLWFMSVLFVLYLLFPVIPVVYAKTRSMGLILLSACCYYFFETSHVLADVSFLPVAVTFFTIGIATCEILTQIPDKAVSSHRLVTGFVLAGVSLASLHQLFATSYQHILETKRFAYDTHHNGLMYYLLFISAGMLLPAVKSRSLRSLANATYPVYLFHFLIVMLFNNYQPFHDVVAKLSGLAAWPVGNSVFAACAAIYLGLLGLGVLYNQWIMSPVTLLTRKCFDNEIVLTPAPADDRKVS